MKWGDIGSELGEKHVLRAERDAPDAERNNSDGGVEMTQWQCSNCGYQFQAESVPERCPSCKQTCTFSDVTCYTPECGGPGNVDPRLAGRRGKLLNE